MEWSYICWYIIDCSDVHAYLLRFDQGAENDGEFGKKFQRFFFYKVLQN